MYVCMYASIACKPLRLLSTLRPFWLLLASSPIAVAYSCYKLPRVQAMRRRHYQREHCANTSNSILGRNLEGSKELGRLARTAISCGVSVGRYIYTDTQLRKTMTIMYTQVDIIIVVRLSASDPADYGKGRLVVTLAADYYSIDLAWLLHTTWFAPIYLRWY